VANFRQLWEDSIRLFLGGKSIGGRAQAVVRNAGGGGGGSRTYEEQQESLVVAVADAVVDPRAVVAHAQHAALAYAAVVAPGRLVALALLAEPYRPTLRFNDGQRHDLRSVRV